MSDESIDKAPSEDAPEHTSFSYNPDTDTVEAKFSESTFLTPEGTQASPGLFHIGPGVRLGQFEIVGELGHGGFGTVYAARDIDLDRTVAIKLLRDPLAEKHQELFRREAKAIARVSSHAHIVEIYAWGNLDGHFYFALEYVQSNVERELKRCVSGLSTADALRIAAECAEALQYAHDAGILHRDIKPQNILLDEDTLSAKLADFGLAQLFDAPEKTATGVVSGTPAYMSPEQTRGERLDGRTDVFSLGVTLYEMLCGARPYEGTSHFEVMEKIRVGERTPLLERCPHIPPAIDAIVSRALESNPDDRFQTAGALAEALREEHTHLSDDGSGTTRSRAEFPARRMSRMPIAGAFAALIALALIVGARVWMNPPGEGHNAMDNVAIAAAIGSMDERRLEQAELAYRDYLETAPEDAQALYGLGLALQLQGRLDEARAEYAKISEEPWKADADAAIALAEGGDDQQSRWEAASVHAFTAYPELLLAEHAARAQEFSRAVELLRAFESSWDSAFLYRWQKRDYLQTLGRALFELGEYEAARAAFERVEGLEDATDAIAAAYVAKLEDLLNEEKRARVRERIDEVAASLEDPRFEPLTAEQQWTSRPFTLWILPPAFADTGDLAVSPVTPVFDYLLGDELATAGRAIEIVDRSLLQEILEEQNLSAKLSRDSGRLALGRVVGARFLVSCASSVLGSEERIFPTVVNIETTTRLPKAGTPAVTSPDDTAWLEELASGIAARLAEEYPIQGIVTVSDDGTIAINVGAHVGVHAGMRFETAPGPLGTPTTVDAAFTVTGVEETSSTVQPDEPTPTGVSSPLHGAYVREIKEKNANDA